MRCLFSMNPCVCRILAVALCALLLAACGDIHYSDSEMSNVRDSQDDDKGGHPDEPIEE